MTASKFEPVTPEALHPPSDFLRQLGGEHLTTAEVLYYLPDHPHLIQSFLWQTLDRAPDFPRISRFLTYWRQEIRAVIHSVQVTGHAPLQPHIMRGGTEITLH